MVKEAEEHAEEDKALKARVDARNKLEGYCYNLKQQLDDEEKGIAGKISADEKEELSAAVSAALEWLEENQTAETEEFEEKQKELEKVINPVMAKVYGASGGAPGGMGGEDDGAFSDEL
jgi:heat shock protein 5